LLHGQIVLRVVELVLFVEGRGTAGGEALEAGTEVGELGLELEVAGEDEGERIRAGRLFDAGKARALPPLVDLAAEGVGLLAEEAELTCSEHPVAARGVNVRDGGVDDRGLGRAADLREVREESGEVEEAAVEGLSALALDGIVGRPALGSVSEARRLALRSGGSGSGVGISDHGGGGNGHGGHACVDGHGR